MVTENSIRSLYIPMAVSYNGENLFGGDLLKNKALLPVLCAALGNILWGLSFLFTKVSLTIAPNPNVMLAHRFTISVLCMGIPLILGKEKISFKGKNWKPILFMLLMQSSYFLFETYGVLYTNATISGLVLAVVPVVTIATGALFLREYPTRRQALFCLMPVAGVIIMTVSGKEMGVVTALGIVFLLLTMLASAVFKTANRMASKEFSTYERTFLVLANSAVVFSLVGMGSVEWDVQAFVAPLLEVKYLLSVVSLGLLCSIAANLLVNYASSHMSVFKVSSFGALSTLCAVVVGVVFLNEPMSWSLMLGVVLILVGIRQVTKPK